MYHHHLPPPHPLSLEQQWSDEVRYLHSLWHQGPPRSHTNPNPKPQPLHPNLAPSNPVSFKKKKKTNSKTIINHVSVSDPGIALSNDWAWKPSPTLETQTESGWPEPVSKPKSPSAEDKEKSAVLQLQRNHFKPCYEFFARNREDPDDDDDDSSDDEDSSDDDEEEENEVFEFFFGIFKEDEELRNYYKSKYEAGEFCCLVCGGIGEKVGKRFKDCVALVQHSTSISKTKRRSAHRAFGQAVCRVLGWDINRLPNIVLSMDDSLGAPLENKENLNGDNANPETDNVGTGENENTNDNTKKGDQVVGAADIEGPVAVEIDYSLGTNEEGADELYEDL